VVTTANHLVFSLSTKEEADRKEGRLFANNKILHSLILAIGVEVCSSVIEPGHSQEQTKSLKLQYEEVKGHKTWTLK
jgi:hypothetical protein